MKILHLDIETAPNQVFSWGLWKQNIAINQIIEPGYTLCWAANWEGSKEVFFNSVHQSDEADMLNEIWHLLDAADAVVHYNGTRFDIPTLNREFIRMGWEPPAPFHQIDLLRIVRQRFKFPSNKLDYVAQALGLGGKEKHIGMALWIGCMEGDKKSWKDMESYNVQDVRLLPQLYRVLLPWIKNHPNHALYTDETRPVCTNCGSTSIKKNGVEHTKTLTYQRYKCNDCLTPMRGRTNILDKDKTSLILTGSKL
jgi:DNA polymerase elongation subunit (family B)